jgi:hypothetical protein
MFGTDATQHAEPGSGLGYLQSLIARAGDRVDIGSCFTLSV